jgi:hypothetical protein
MDNRLSEDVMLDEVLRTPPEPRIPANFRQRRLTRLPEVPQLGLDRWLTQPSILVTILSIEIVCSAVLLWRARA